MHKDRVRVVTVLLATLITFISAAALVAVSRWRPEHTVACGAQVLALLGLLGVLAGTHGTYTTLSLTIIGACAIIVYWRQGRVTGQAAVVVWAVGVFVLLRYPPPWTVSIVFLLGWAQFAGTLGGASSGASASTRDVTDMLPAIIILLAGAVLINQSFRTAAIIVFGGLAFVVNDVLASDLGPLLPGRAHLFPRLATVPHGTPGAISYAGTVVGLLGSASTGACTSALTHSVTLGSAVCLGGITAALLDTALSQTHIRHIFSRGRELVNSVACVSAGVIGLAIVHVVQSY